MTLVRAANTQARRIGIRVHPDAYADTIQSATAAGDATAITREFPTS